MSWQQNLLLALSIPFFYFFFLVVSADLQDEQLQYRYKARLPEIVRTLVCSVPIINLISPHLAPGSDPFALYLAIGLLSAPFAVSLVTAPSNVDAQRLTSFAPRWALSKIEAAFYGLIIFIFSGLVFGYTGIPDDLPKRIINTIVPELVVGNAVPTTALFFVAVAGAICRGLIVARAMQPTRIPFVFHSFLLLSTIGALMVWLLALAQSTFEPSDWRAPVGGVLGIVIAMLCDFGLKRDVYLVAQTHGKW